MSDDSFYKMKAQKNLYLAKSEQPKTCGTCGNEKSRVILCSACYRLLRERLAEAEQSVSFLRGELVEISAYGCVDDDCARSSGTCFCAAGIAKKALAATEPI